MISWFRDYVYIPLGGSRGGKLLQYRNIAIIFVLSGIWHGASWTFAIWGAINAAYIIVGLATAPMRDRLATATGFARLPRLRATWQWASTLAIVSMSHVWFRAGDVGTALQIYRNLPLGWGDLSGERFDGLLIRFGMDAGLFAFTVLLIPVTELIEYRFRHLDAWRAPTALRWLGDWILLGATLTLGYYGRQAFVDCQV